MKKILITACAGVLAASAASAQGTIDLRGVEYRLDTVYHAKVGPGTTHTQLRLEGPASLDVFYATIDLTTPGVSIRAVCATDKVAGCARTSAMAQSKSHDGLHYFVGTNGDFYSTSGYATNGSSVIGTPTTSCTVDGEVYKTSTANYQFVVDRDGVPYVTRLNYYTGTATIGEKVTLFKGINVSSPANGITLYTPRYWGSANQQAHAGACAQVTARLVDGDKFTAGGKYRLEVTSTPTDDGDTTIPNDGFVIHGRGTSKSGCNTSALDFVNGLKPGDIVEMDNIVLTSDGKQIYPYSIVSGNPKNVGDGQTLDTEGERSDASVRHPRTCIGHSTDGSKIIMMVIDGRSTRSAGVTTSILADVMRHAGAAEAVNIDGGGSSTFYTEALGVLNKCSDGNERAVGNAIYAVLEAPEDNEIAEIRFADWRKDVPTCGLYTPRVYAYNKHGLMLTDDFTGYTLSCPQELGTIIHDGKALEASGSGYHALTAKYGDLTASIPITVHEADAMLPRLDTVIIDAKRAWDAEVISTVNGQDMPVSHTALTWSSSNDEIASVTVDGNVRGIANGTATITGTRGNHVVHITVNVEIPHAQFQPIVTEPQQTWSMSQSGMTSVEFAPYQNGLVFDYIVKTTRAPRITMSAKQPIFSMPEGVRLRINPGQAAIKNVSLSLQPENADRPTNFTFDNIVPSTENTFTVDLNKEFDLDDIAAFPIKLVSMTITPASKANEECHVEMPGIEAVYDPSALSVEQITSDTPSALITITAQGVTFLKKAPSVTVTDIAGRVILTVRDVDALNLSHLTPGLYIVAANIDGTTATVKFLK